MVVDSLLVDYTDIVVEEQAEVAIEEVVEEGS